MIIGTLFVVAGWQQLEQIKHNKQILTFIEIIRMITALFSVLQNFLIWSLEFLPDFLFLVNFIFAREEVESTFC